MLPAAHRLRSSADIARVYKRGSHGGSGGVLTVKAAPSGRPQTRAVVVVGKKVSKKAVLRNRIRRRLTEALRGDLATVAPGYDIVVSVHADISETPAPAIREHLTRALTRAGVRHQS
jgi:ribonuclease P protein component